MRLGDLLREFQPEARTSLRRGPGLVHADIVRFKTPSLRNVALTTPNMLDGHFETLEEVIRHCAGRETLSPTLDPNLSMHPDGGGPLSDADQRALVAFLRSLTDEDLASPAQRVAGT